MNCYLINWNPSRYDWVRYNKVIQVVRSKGTGGFTWSCGNSKSIVKGSHFFFLRQGTEPRGIMGHGKITSTPYAGEHWSGEKGRLTNYVDLVFEELLDFRKESERMISTKTLQDIFPEQNWAPQGSGIRVKENVFSALMELWMEKQDKLSPELEDTTAYEEGKRCNVVLNRYERNIDARKKCLEINGYICKVCGLSMDELYGDLGKNYIQVHHLNPISNSAAGRKTDPAKDLIPVCPNCHSMLHRCNPPITPEALRALIRENK